MICSEKTRNPTGISFQNSIKECRLRYTVRPVAMLCGLMFASSSIAADNDRVYQFDIAGGPMSKALSDFSDTSRLDINYPANVVSDIKSNGLKGSYTIDQALRQLLKGSNLTYRMTEENAVTVERIQLAQVADPTNMPAVTVTGKAIYDSTDPYNEDYRLTNASTATKTDTPIMETPYSVTVVPSQVLEDKQVVRLEDAIASVAGVQTSWTNGGLSDVFMMRGFQNTTIYRDGFFLPDQLGGGTARRQTANLERVEVLKGPGSILYGRNQPGGVINMVTKRPLAESYHSIQQQFGSYDFYRTLIDSTGAITSDRSLLYRANFSYENSGSFRDFVSNDDVFFAPSLTWNISDKTQANLDITYEHFNQHTDSGVPALNGRPAPVPINRQVGDPKNNLNAGDRTYVGFNWWHKFNDNWKLSHSFGAEFFDATSYFTFYGFPDANGNFNNVGSDYRGFNNAVVHQQRYYTTLNLTGNFNTGMLEHSTLWGFDYFNTDDQIMGDCCGSPPNFNIFNPTYLTEHPQDNFNSPTTFNQEWYGLYFQDQIKLPFNLYANFGLRYDNTGSFHKENGVISGEDHVSPRGGLLWRPLQWLSVYGNYSENFGPSNTLFNAPGQTILPPQLANEWELGAKTEFLDGRLSAGFAYFDLTKQNVPVSDPDNWLISRPSGEQESRGYEFEVAGEIMPGWRTVAAYTHIPYARINNDAWEGAMNNTGHRLYNVPRNFGSLWNTYEFQNGTLRGLKFGGGIVAADQSYGRNENDFKLPGYLTLNLMSSYSMEVMGKKLTLQVNANNLLDKTYYPGSNTYSMIGVGAPRTFLGSIKVEF